MKMAEKRKSEDVSEAVKHKKYKRYKKDLSKIKKKSDGKSTGVQTGNSAEVSVKKISKTPLSAPSQSVRQISNENTNNKNQGQNKTGKKSKMWKHWERRKKQRKNKVINKTDEGKKKTSPAVPVTQSGKKEIAGSKKDKPSNTGAKMVDVKQVESRKPTQPVSCNWKKLKMDIEKSKPKKKCKKKTVRKSEQTKREKNEAESVEPEIWFDDVDEELLRPQKEIPVRKQPAGRGVSRQSKAADGLVKEHSFKGLTKAVGLDCEMVGVGDGGKESVLARVSVVNQHGECLYDTFVRSREDVVDYRTQWSGVTPDKLENATDFLDAQKAVSDLLRGRILVGHAVHHDLKVLFLDHPHKDIRDTSRYKPYRQLFKGRTPSLKNLTSRLLDVKIQTGEHNSVTDAQAAMRLYTFSRQEWEGHLKKRKTRRPKPKPKPAGGGTERQSD